MAFDTSGARQSRSAQLAGTYRPKGLLMNRGTLLRCRLVCTRRPTRAGCAKMIRFSVLNRLFSKGFPVITTSNITMQFGAKPLFEGVGQVRRRQPLWPDRRQRLRQVHLHEDSRRP